MIELTLKKNKARFLESILQKKNIVSDKCYKN